MSAGLFLRKDKAIGDFRGLLRTTDFTENTGLR